MPPTARRSACGPVAVAVLTVAGLAVATAVDPAKPPPVPRFPFGADEAKAYQQEYAKAAGRPGEVTNAIGMRLVLVPPGRFEMGPNGSKYRVTLSKPFYAGVTEVTLGQYRKFKSGHPAAFRANSFTPSDDPVEKARAGA